MKELRLAGISTIAAANAWLPGFIAEHNARFGRAPANATPGSAYELLGIIALLEEPGFRSAQVSRSAVNSLSPWLHVQSLAEAR